MQLTKDDIRTEFMDVLTPEGWISSHKLKKIIEFYDKYKENPFELESDYPELIDKWLEQSFEGSAKEIRKDMEDLDTFFYEQVHNNDGDYYTDWLFNYCFKDGLK